MLSEYPGREDSRGLNKTGFSPHKLLQPWGAARTNLNTRTNLNAVISWQLRLFSKTQRHTEFYHHDHFYGQWESKREEVIGHPELRNK